MQTAFGRRPVLLASTMICLVSNIWRAVAKDYGSFMGACILNGVGAGVAEVGPNDDARIMHWLIQFADRSTSHHCRSHVLARKRRLEHALLYHLFRLFDGKCPSIESIPSSNPNRLAPSLPVL
jgi:hypothetical protein